MEIEIQIKRIENGWTVYSSLKTTYCKDGAEVVEKIKEIIGDA